MFERQPTDKLSNDAYNTARIDTIFEITDRYPLLSGNQMRLAYSYRDQGLGLPSLLIDPLFSGVQDEEFQTRISNAASDSQTIEELLVLCNMRLVIQIAKKISGGEYEDRIQEGVIGLTKAVRAFDPSLGFEFSTYAYPYIKGEISRLGKERYKSMGFGDEVTNAIFRGKRTWNDLTVKLGREPTREELATHLIESGVNNFQALEAARTIVHSLDVNNSLDREIPTMRGTLADLIIDEDTDVADEAVDSVHNDDVRKKVNDAISSRLSERDADILRRRNGIEPHSEPMSGQAVGDLHNLTRQMISIIEAKARKRLRYAPGLKELIAE